MTKKFFHVCAGLFLLALSYHIGAQNARAQSGTTIDSGSFGQWWTCAVGRTFYYQIGGLSVPEPIPGTSRVIATGGTAYGAAAMLENGDVYVYDGYPNGGGPWSLYGNMLGAPTPIQSQSWGKLKARYRPTPSATTPTTR